MEKKYVWGVVGVVVLVMVFLLFGQGKDGIDGRNGRDGLGAVSTLDGVDFPYVSINNRRTWQGGITISATSSILCSMQNPFGATSTLRNFSMVVTNNGFGATQDIDVSTSTDAFGSSSPAFIKQFETGAEQFHIVFNGSGSGTTTDLRLIGLTPHGAGDRNFGGSDNIIGPTEYVNVGTGSTSASTFDTFMVGFCNFEFERL